MKSRSGAAAAPASTDAAFSAKAYEGILIEVLVIEQDRVDNVPLAGGSDLASGIPLLTEADQDLLVVDARIAELLDELAILEESHCVDCPRSQEQLIHENRIARCRLLLIAQQRLRQELVDDR